MKSETPMDEWLEEYGPLMGGTSMAFLTCWIISEILDKPPHWALLPLSIIYLLVCLIAMIAAWKQFGQERQVEPPSFQNLDGSPMTKEDYLKLDDYNK